MTGDSSTGPDANGPRLSREMRAASSAAQPGVPPRLPLGRKKSK